MLKRTLKVENDLECVTILVNAGLLQPRFVFVELCKDYVKVCVCKTTR